MRLRRSPVPLFHPPASHQPSHVARVKVSRLFLFAAARVPARCASSALPQQNITISRPGAHSSLWIDFEKAIVLFPPDMPIVKLLLCFCLYLQRRLFQPAALQARFRSRTSQSLSQALLTFPCESTVR